MCYDTNTYIREATPEEAAESRLRINGVFSIDSENRILREDEATDKDLDVFVVD
jgi:hypothetical protein